MKTNRREFLQGAAALALTPLASPAAQPAGADSSAREVVLENRSLKAVFDSATGALLELSNPRTGRAFQGRRELARSFTLVVPLPQRLLNVVDGLQQKPAHFERAGDKLTFVWEELENEHAGRLPIRVTATVTLSEGGLVFEMDIVNQSPYAVESVAWPYLGDLKRPAEGEFRSAHNTYCNLSYSSLAPQFVNQRGYWGTEFPIQMIPTPESPWVLILDKAEGLYAGYHDTGATEQVEFTFQWKPGYWKESEVPPGPEISGQAANLEFLPTHFPLVQPGKSGSLSPIVLQPFSGDWHAGADVYRSWRKSWMTRPRTPAWVQDVHSWQMLQMSTWGDSLRIRFRDLPAYAAECARNGVTAIQLIGWTLYGQDGRLPIHDIDPRLGTREELREAIAEARRLGVRIILYEKYTCADKSTDWYRRELHHYSSKDLFGNEHGHEGWRYDTPAHLAGINIRPYAWMCMNSARWQEVALEEIRKSLDLNAAGIFLDECAWHGSNAFYCYDPAHGHPVPAYNFAGDAVFERKMRKLLESRDPDLLLSGEGPYDLQSRHYSLSYHRTSMTHTPSIRYIDPFLPMMNWVVDYDDRESVNICLLYRYIMSYEPRNFRGHLEEFPLTLEYGKKVDALRRRYREYLWDGEFQDTLGAKVETVAQPAGAPEGKPVYSIFRSLSSGRKAVVVVNHGASVLRVRVDTGRKVNLVAVSPENPEPRRADSQLEIPARSAVVAIESA